MQSDPTTAARERRRFLSAASSFALAVSLLASYGTFAFLGGRFLLPARRRRESWLLVSDLASFRRGTTRTIVAPGGERIVVARRAGDGAAPPALAEFVALSSTCPHLGCQVRFEPQHQRFFCPCHNGVFDPDGRAISGPPFDAGQSLPRYELRIDEHLVFIRVPVEGVA